MLVDVILTPVQGISGQEGDDGLSIELWMIIVPAILVFLIIIILIIIIFLIM